jgi:hypothetical protein
MEQTRSVRTPLGTTPQHVPGCQRPFCAECRDGLDAANLPHLVLTVASQLAVATDGGDR